MHHMIARLLALIAVLMVLILTSTTGRAEDMALLSIGPRLGFTGKTPFLGREQKHNFHLTDVAAVFTLPWSWRLGQSPWSVEPRLIASAGYLAAAGEGGFIGTAVPVLALSGWDRFVSIDAGMGAAVFSRDTFGAQDFGGPVQIVATIGIQVRPFAHAYAGFRLQHFSDAGLYGSNSLGVDMYIVEIGYRF